MILLGFVLVLLCWLLGFWLLWSIPVPARAGGRPDRRGAGPAPRTPRVSVVIPARNEEHNLPCLLQSLAYQTRRADEIIVVDDHSTDATASVAARLGARVVSALDLPVGWLGKPWACWQGATAASGDLLIFLDADTALTPDGLANLIAEYGRKGGLLSVQPYHVTLRAYERLAAGLNISLMMAMNVFTPLGERLPPSGAFGPCVVCGRADYFATGGHKSVKSAILEDSFLGRVFARAGLPVRCLGGQGTVSFRMYPEGLGQVIEGWTKTLGSGSTGTRSSTLALITTWMFGCVATIGVGVWLAADGAYRGDALLWALFAAAYVGYAAQIHWMLRRIGDFGVWPGPLFPVVAGFYVAVAVRAVSALLGIGQVRWKGRALSTRPYREVGWGGDAKLGR